MQCNLWSELWALGKNSWCRDLSILVNQERHGHTLADVAGSSAQLLQIEGLAAHAGWSAIRLRAGAAHWEVNKHVGCPCVLARRVRLLLRAARIQLHGVLVGSWLKTVGGDGRKVGRPCSLPSALCGRQWRALGDGGASAAGGGEAVGEPRPRTIGDKVSIAPELNKTVARYGGRGWRGRCYNLRNTLIATPDES